MSDNQPTIHHSPIGVAANWPALYKPDTKFNANGVYKTDHVLSGEDAQGIIEIINEGLVEAKKMAEAEQKKARSKGKKLQIKQADLPYTEVVDPDSGDETGEISFRYKSTAGGVSKKTGKAWSRKLDLFDSKGKPFSRPIYAGSKIIIAFVAKPWANAKGEYSVKLEIWGVQVIELVSSGGGRSAAALGFTSHEGGYEATDEDNQADQDGDEKTSTSADDLDDDTDESDDDGEEEEF